jgi:ubiquinone/menaquinone biosynthesis C-methylase UbiE
MDDQLKRIHRAYDLSVTRYLQNIDPFIDVPDEFKNSPEFKTFLQEGRECNGGAADIKKFLAPKSGMRFLDAGCGGGLAEYYLHDWSSEYNGVDISQKMIEAMREYVTRKKIAIGGLWVADLAKLPFENNFFDITMVIGVFEYYPQEYCRQSLAEIHRCRA